MSRETSKVREHPYRVIVRRADCTKLSLCCVCLAVRKSLRPRFSTSQLTYTKILQQRSAVPAVVTHSTSSTPAYKRKLSHEEKDRLLRMAKKARKGPFNAIMDHTEFGAGSALLELSEAAKKSGGYDVWAHPQEDDEDETEAFVPKKAAPKVSPRSIPIHLQLTDLVL